MNEIKIFNASLNPDKSITPEFLLSHGFEKRTIEEAEIVTPAFDVQVELEEILFVEKGIHRNLFAVVLGEFEKASGEFYSDVWIQDDIGCGFIEIPRNITQYSELDFAMLFYAIRNKKLMNT